MLALITAMLLCLGLAVSVVGVVAIPARREGRELFTHPVRGAGGADPADDAGAAGATGATGAVVATGAAGEAGETDRAARPIRQRHVSRKRS
jgi:hypothetical protein